VSATLIHRRFEAQVRRTPDATAVAGEQGSLSYAELNGRANQVARYLAGRGVGPGARIGVCCERTFELIVGVYGILKAGAAYVPMDPAYPGERLEYMAAAAGLDFVLTQAHLAFGLSRLRNVRLVLLDGPQTEWSSLGREDLDVPVSGDDLIYVIFTSGTTGRPKGAAVYHRGFSNLVDWFVTEFQITADDRVLLVSSPSFDLTQKNLYAPLVTGGVLCLSGPGPYEVARLARSIRGHGITLINCTPSAFYPLVEDGGDYSELTSLRVVFLGGEPISLARLRDWFTSPGCRAEVANTYGPTECTDICAFHRVTRANMDEFAFVPLGRAVTNVQLVVVNEAMQACGIGEAGELCVGGAGVGAGYINDPGQIGRAHV
jgi:amino acid adenylation domain-containing protein